MITRKTVRNIVTLVSVLGTGQIVSGVVARNTNPKSLPEKAAIKIGSVAIAATVAEKTEPATDKILDAVFDLYDTVRGNTKTEK